jgi:hypothetical protein
MAFPDACRLSYPWVFVLNGTLSFQVVTNKSQCLKVSRHLMKDSFPIEKSEE